MKEGTRRVQKARSNRRANLEEVAFTDTCTVCPFVGFGAMKLHNMQVFQVYFSRCHFTFSSDILESSFKTMADFRGKSFPLP